MSDILKLVPKNADTDTNGNGTGGVPEWLRAIANMVEKGGFGKVGAAVVIMREDSAGNDGSQFCLRTRRCNMNYVEQVGALRVMLHDMLTG